MPLDPINVPENIRFLVPSAEQWGLPDGVVRDRLIEHSSEEVLVDLVETVTPYIEIIDEWLVGTADKRPVTFEYVAFSCLWLAVDMARFRLEQNHGTRS